MGDKKGDGGHQKMFLSDTSDPLGLRSVRLGGDAPSLRSESAFVRKEYVTSTVIEEPCANPLEAEKSQSLRQPV